MKILVTGGAGFVGSTLVDRLVNEGHDVSVIDDLSTGNINNLVKSKDKISFYNLDVSKPFYLGLFDIVYNLACHARSFSFANPQRDIDVNVGGILNSIKSVKKGGRIIYSSNSGIYDTSKLPINENTSKDKPTTPYDINKLSGEYFLKVYAELYNYTPIIFRFATVYGPRQRVNELFNWFPLAATFCKNICNNKPIRIDGDGSQTRDMVYVDDVVTALTSSINTDNHFNPILLATGHEYSVKDIAKLLILISGREVKIENGIRKLGDIDKMKYDITRSKEFINWSAETNLNEGLKITYDWWENEQNR